jgi:hypothetical protein
MIEPMPARTPEEIWADGTWRWLIGDPFTVGRRVPADR